MLDSERCLLTMDTQGRDGEENLASEQLLVGKWVERGGGGGAVFRLQGGSAPNQWKVCQRRTNIIKLIKNVRQFVKHRCVS